MSVDHHVSKGVKFAVGIILFFITIVVLAFKVMNLQAFHLPAVVCLYIFIFIVNTFVPLLIIYSTDRMRSKFPLFKCELIEIHV